jgi:hypothetical protein
MVILVRVKGGYEGAFEHDVMGDMDGLLSWNGHSISSFGLPLKNNVASGYGGLACKPDSQYAPCGSSHRSVGG